MIERNAKVSTELELQWRVEIHLDDVIIDGANVMGYGVNISPQMS
jgi:hypothetical protein